jgi:hypothetical protein
MTNFRCLVLFYNKNRNFSSIGTTNEGVRFQHTPIYLLTVKMRDFSLGHKQKQHRIIEWLLIASLILIFTHKLPHFEICPIQAV